MDVAVWFFRIIFMVISLGLCAAGVLVLLGRRISGMPRRNRGTASMGVARLITSSRVLGAIWVFIGLFGLLVGVASW
jgi:hypothetical protein